MYYNLRNMEPGAGRRKVAWGDDAGESFGDLHVDPALPEPVCHAGVAYVGRDADRPDGTILFANPDHSRDDGRVNDSDRRDMTLRASFDRGRTWPVRLGLNDAYAGYADVAAVPGGTPFCLYECGSESSIDRINLARVPIGRLMQKGRGATPC